jgi:small subunit ribosomal protein S6
MEKARSYIGVFIVDPEKEDTLEAIKKDITSVISDNSGKVIKENLIGQKPLAYPIMKKETGIYLEVTFDIEPQAIEKISRQFRINTDLLRTLIDKI